MEIGASDFSLETNKVELNCLSLNTYLSSTTFQYSPGSVAKLSDFGVIGCANCKVTNTLGVCQKWRNNTKTKLEEKGVWQFASILWEK